MNLDAPPLRDFAERLLAEECDSGDGANGSAARRVCGKLGETLSKLAGAAGYRALISRALVLAQAEVPWLGQVRVAPDGQLEGLDEARAGTEKDQFTRGEVTLVARLLGLLITFIGEPLTHQLVKGAWPAIVPPPSSATPTP